MHLYFLVGNALRLFSVIYLLLKLSKTRSCEGVSGKTQLLFFLAYLTRHIDVVLAYYDSVTYTIGKLAYITLHLITVLLIFIVFKKTYKWTEDTLSTEVLLWASVTMAIWFSNEMSRQEVSYAFSMFLEALAILPQIYMIYKRGAVEKSLLYYLIPLGLDRLAYLLNWIYRFNTEPYVDTMTNTTGVLHLTMYLAALFQFVVFIVKVAVDEERRKFLKSNIFLVSSNHPYRDREMMKTDEEKKSAEDGFQKV